jgi:hypothetical protein
MAMWSSLRITEDEVKQNYEREEAPSPANYYLKDYPYEETTLQLPTFRKCP